MQFLLDLVTEKDQMDTQDNSLFSGDINRGNGFTEVQLDRLHSSLNVDHPAYRNQALREVVRKNKTGVTVVNDEANNESPDGKRVLTEEAAYEKLGFSFSTLKKWLILSSIFAVQISMNFNAAIYASAVPGMVAHFHVTPFQVRLGQMIFLVMYAFGCELWAPWSEELGRKWVLQGSLFMVNISQIPCALAPNFWTVFGFRLVGGLSSAGGSVTLGMVADMWEPDVQQYAVAFVVLSSVGGSVVGPIAGGFIAQYLPWQWAFWTSLILGAVVQAAHFFVPETRTTILLDREAKRRREEGEDPDIYGPNEVRGNFWQRVSFRHSLKLMWRPYQFLLFEPIVTFLSLLSGFSDALIFTSLDSFGLVLDKWRFDLVQKGLAFIPLLVGYFIAYATFLPVYRHDRRAVRADPHVYKPERRLWWLLYLAPLEVLGLFGFAWCSLGPSHHIPWIAPLLFTVLIGVANFAIYMATIDYMIAAYGEFSASATGGNGFCRDFLAGIAALYATPFYENLAPGTDYQLVIPTLILTGVAALLIIPVYVFFFHGGYFRRRSRYAAALAEKRAEKRGARAQLVTRTGSPGPPRENSPERALAASVPSARSTGGELAGSPAQAPASPSRARPLGWY